jgi:hypothetical protein
LLRERVRDWSVAVRYETDGTGDRRLGLLHLGHDDACV